MPTVKVNDISMYYEIIGEGEPLVLIEGLGYSTWMWYKQLDELSKHFKVIMFDNRGVGKTDKPDSEYSIEMMADDLAGLLRSLNIKKTHILGVSMGGFIAQQFSANYPEMVDRLILCSTSFGGPNSIPIPQETLDIMMKGGGEYKTLLDIKKAISTAFYDGKIPEDREVLDKIMTEKRQEPQPKYAYQRQLMAGASFNGEANTQKIKAETLIVAGEKDKVVPPENAHLLHERICSSKLEIIENGGHVFFMEQPDKSNEVFLNFLTQK
ncbi:alpha/beta fold hydrolase [Proteinivorax hydrogeniformans]|uniref:Alpha/beta fold hydrolase n=1 Tax=Proteinivorax hydrogeniformans TaxID=1826727 RepID=A0AAU8HSM8_9FIRM